VIYYLAAQIDHCTSRQHGSRIRRLYALARAIEAEEPSECRQVIFPHAQDPASRIAADILEHGHALIWGLAAGRHRTEACLVPVGPEQSPSVAQQIRWATTAELPIERFGADRLTRLELPETTQRVERPDDDPLDDTPARPDVTRLGQLLRVYYAGAEQVCGTGAIQVGRVGGGGLHRARSAQVEVGLQIAQATGVFERARRDPRWVGLSASGAGGPLSVEERFSAHERTEMVVYARGYLGMPFTDVARHAKIEAATLKLAGQRARRCWIAARAALRDALDERVACRHRPTVTRENA